MDDETKIRIGAKIRAARKGLGIKGQDKFAEEMGIGQSTIDRIERGEWKRMPSDLPRIAKRLALSLEELDPLLVGTEASVEFASTIVGQPDLPILGSAEGGKGVLILTNDPVDVVRRPASLLNVRDAYAVMVTGNSMIPVMRPGHIALVNPHLPAMVDEEAVLQREDHDTRYGMIKTFLGSTGAVWRLRQWNPRRDFTVSKKDWPECHLVVGKYSRR